jgi:carbon-monoxide dehydrogenase medium subunit
VKPAVFSYHDPQTLAEVLDLLGSCGDEAKLLAGGQSLIPLMNMRLARPEHVIDLRRVPGLAGIEPDATSVRVGAMVAHRRVETDPVLRSVNPLLAEAAGYIAHVQIRERGTLGGALAHADPAGEMPLVATVLDASLTVHSARGQRSLTPADFFESVFTSSLEQDEVLVDAVFPRLAGGDGWAVEEVSRRHGDFAIVSVAVWLTLTDGEYSRIRVGLGGVGPTPVLSRRATELMVGQVPAPRLWRGVADAVAAEITPGADIHATADDRRDLARTLVYRALQSATRRGQQDGAASAAADHDSARRTA